MSRAAVLAHALLFVSLAATTACGEQRSIEKHVWFNEVGAVEDWIEDGGDVRGRSLPLLVNATGPKGGIDVLRVLLEAGADANVRDAIALDNAADWGALDKCRLLVMYGADPYVRSKDGKDFFDRMSNRRDRDGALGDYFRALFRKRGHALLEKCAWLEALRDGPVCLSLDEFFRGNTSLASIGANLTPHPGLAPFYATLRALRDREDVQDVLLAADAGPDAVRNGWPFCETIWVLASMPLADVRTAIAPLRASNLAEGWVHRPGNAPPVEPTMRPVWVWWD